MLLAVVAVLVGEYLVPVTERMAEQGRAAALKVRIKQQKDLGLWLRDGATYVHVGEVLPDLSLLRVDIYEFDAGDRLVRHVRAARGSYNNDNNDARWQLADVRESAIDVQLTTRRVRLQDWPTGLAPDLFKVFTVRPEALSVPQLYQYMRHLDQNRQNTGPYALPFWQKLVSPFSTVVMMVVAIPFVFGLQRSGGVGARLFSGIVLGLAFFVVSRGFGYFGLLYGVPAVLGATLPTLLFFGFALVMLRRLNEFYSMEGAAQRDFRRAKVKAKPAKLALSRSPLVHMMYVLRHISVHTRPFPSRMEVVTVLSEFGGTEHEFSYSAVMIEPILVNDLYRCHEVNGYYDQNDLGRALTWFLNEQQTFGVSEVFRAGVNIYCRELLSSLENS